MIDMTVVIEIEIVTTEEDEMTDTLEGDYLCCVHMLYVCAHPTQCVVHVHSPDCTQCYIICQEFQQICMNLYCSICPEEWHNNSPVGFLDEYGYLNKPVIFLS